MGGRRGHGGRRRRDDLDRPAGLPCRRAGRRRRRHGAITPGPLVITATFIGYLVGGLAGALVATVAIFIPIYLGVVIPGRWFVRHREHPQLKAFVRGATAAAAGAIAGATVVLAKGAIVDWQTALIALGGLGFVLRFKNREPVLVLLAAAAGVLLKGI